MTNTTTSPVAKAVAEYTAAEAAAREARQKLDVAIGTANAELDGIGAIDAGIMKSAGCAHVRVSMADADDGGFDDPMAPWTQMVAASTRHGLSALARSANAAAARWTLARETLAATPCQTPQEKLEKFAAVFDFCAENGGVDHVEEAFDAIDSSMSAYLVDDDSDELALTWCARSPAHMSRIGERVAAMADVDTADTARQETAGAAAA